MLDRPWPRPIGDEWLAPSDDHSDRTWHLTDLEVGDDPHVGGPDREYPEWFIDDQKKRIWTLCRVGLHGDRVLRSPSPPLAERCGICLDYAKGRLAGVGD